MYADPRKIKKNIVKVCLDDDINQLVDALVVNTGGQKQVIARELLIQGLKNKMRDLGVVQNISA